MNMDQSSPGSIDLSARAAEATMRALENLAPPLDEALDYDDCLLLGLWRRLDAEDRSIPVFALRILEYRAMEPPP